MTLKERLASLRRRFSDQPNVIQTRAGAERLAVRSLRPHWIVGRDLTMFRCEDFSNVPRKRRRAALQLKVPVWSPFEHTGWHAVWADGLAMVWFWDAAMVTVRAQPFAAPMDLTRVEVRPETVFLPRRANGAWLVRTAHGWDLQHWRGGALRASFWFPQRPSDVEINDVLARHGADGAPVPVEQDAVPRHAEVSWRSPQTPGEWLTANERPLAAACLLAVALIAVWQEARFLKLTRMEASAAEQSAALAAELGPIARTRAEALGLRRHNDALAAVLNVPSQARLMSLVDAAIPNATTRFDEWRYQQGELTVIVADAEQGVDTVAYVRALEAEPLFEQVRVGRAQGEDRVRVTLQVRL